MQAEESAKQPCNQQPKQQLTPPSPFFQFTTMMSLIPNKVSYGPADQPQNVPGTTANIPDGEGSSDAQQESTTFNDSLVASDQAPKTQDDDVGEGTITVTFPQEDTKVDVCSQDSVEGAPDILQQFVSPVSDSSTLLPMLPATGTPSSRYDPAVNPPEIDLPEASDINSSNSIGKVLLPNRPIQDVARDTKRILEICYGSDAVPTSRSSDFDDHMEGAATADVDDKPVQDEKGRKRPARKRKIRKASEGEITESDDRKGEVDTASSKKSTKKKSTTKSIPTVEDGDGSTTTLKKKKKKRAKGKKEVLPRDAAGKIVRKRRKIKGRHKVVRSQFIKKGKDVKTDLPTITEDDFDDEYGESGDEDYGDGDEEDRDADDVDSVDQQDDDDDDDDDDDVSDDDEDDEETDDDDRDCVRCQNSEEDVGEHLAAEQKAIERPESIDEEQNCIGPTNIVLPDRQDEKQMSACGHTEDSSDGVEPVVLKTADVIVVDLEAQSDTSPTANARETSKPLEHSFGSSDGTTSVYEDTSDPTKPRFLASNKSKVCAGFLLVSAVAALVVMIMFVTSAIGKRSNPGPIPVANSTAPPYSAPPELSPTLAPSNIETQSPSAPDISTQEPTSMIVHETLVPTNPCRISGVQIIEAETARLDGNATTGTRTSGYCKDGYVGGLVSSETRVTFSNVEIATTGLYRARLRYSNAMARNLPATLQIDSVNIDYFRCSSTGNWSNWTVEDLDDVILHKGSHIVVVLTDEDREEGPLMDWIGFELKSDLTRFVYVTKLLSPYINFTAPSQAQVSTLLWLSSIDSMDWSEMTNREITERFILVEFYYSTEGDLWSTKNEWLSELHVCFWFGVSCSTDDLVTDLMLGE
jgi:hypothetical protein